MNILTLTSAYPQPDDGSEVVTPTVKYFCKKWVEDGHNVIVIHSNSCFPSFFYWIPDSLRKKISSRVGHNFPTKESRKKIEYSKEGICVYRIPMVKIIPHGKFSGGKIKKQTRMIEEILSKEKFTPDVIIAHWANPQIELIEGLARKYDAKTSLVFHGDCSQRNIDRFNLIEKVKRLDAVGCRNKAYANYVKNVLGLSKQPFICYSGIPDNLAESQLKNLSTLTLQTEQEYIFVGRLVKYKNVDVIIRALNRTYGNKSFVLHIVGEGAERENLESLVEELGISSKVMFHGQMDRLNVFELLKRCYCFTMVSDNETFGMVYIEAMLAGCITIASKDGGVDGVIRNGVNGFVSKQGDEDDLVRTFTKIANMNENDRQNLRINAIETALEFRDSQIAKKYLDDIFLWKSGADSK